MPAAIPIITAIGANAAVTAGVLTAMQAAALTVITTVAVSSHQAGRARRKAANAAADARRNQQLVVRSATVPRRLVYGRAMLSGPMALCESTGDANQYLHVVLPLCEGPIDAIEEIYLNEVPIGVATLDGNGFSQAAAFTRQTTESGQTAATISGAGAWSVTLPVGATVLAAVVPYSGDYEGGRPLDEQAPYTVSGETVSGTMPTSYAGQAVYVSYSYPATIGRFVRARLHLGASDQQADADLVAELPAKWTTAHRLQGIAYVYLRLERDERAFPNGFPNIKVRLRGRKVYDPRTGATAWTQNPALHVRDYLTNYLAAPGAAVNDTLCAAAANTCDEMVQSAGRPAASAYGVTELAPISGLEPRYTANGAFDLTTEPQTVLSELVEQMAGLLAFSEGSWLIRAGAYEAPTIALGDADLIAPLRVRPRTKRRELFNGVRAKYRSAAHGFIEHDATPYASSTYRTQDGGIAMWHDIDLPLCDSNSEAQRLERLTLELARRQMVIEATCSTAAGLRLQAGDTVTLTSARHGLSAKVFRIMRWRWIVPHAVQLLLREEDSGAYSWDPASAASTPPPRASTLPGPSYAPQPGALTLASGTDQLLIGHDGTITSRLRIGWTPTAGDPATLERHTEYQRMGSSEWTALPRVPASAGQVYIAPVQDGVVYLVRQRTVNLFGVMSDWTYAAAHTVVGKTEPPPAPTQLRIVGDTLLWTAAEAIDLAGYLVRIHRGSVLSWGDATPLHDGVVTEARYTMASRPAGPVAILVKSVDTSGNESTDFASLVSNLGDAVLGNVFATTDFKAAGWPGTKENCAASGGELLATQGALFYNTDSADFYSLAANADAATFYFDSYDALSYTDAMLVLSEDAGARMVIDAQLTGDRTWIEWRLVDNAAFYGSDSATFYGSDSAGFYSTDAGSLYSSDQATPWTGYAAPFFAEAGTYQFRARASAGKVQGRLSVLRAMLDVPDVLLGVEDVAIPAGGARLTAAAGRFRAIKGVQLTLQTTGAAAAIVSDKDPTLGPYVYCIDTAGQPIAATVDALIQGY